MQNIARKILYAEDDPDDREFFAHAVSSVDKNVELLFVENGVQAIKQLELLSQGDDKLPGLVILDLNMPYMDGKTTLAKIKNNPVFKDVSILIFTSSANPADKNFFANIGIEMITKPSDTLQLQSIAKHMIEMCS